MKSIPLGADPQEWDCAELRWWKSRVRAAPTPKQPTSGTQESVKPVVAPRLFIGIRMQREPLLVGMR